MLEDSDDAGGALHLNALTVAEGNILRCYIDLLGDCTLNCTQFA